MVRRTFLLVVPWQAGVNILQINLTGKFKNKFEDMKPI